MPHDYPMVKKTGSPLTYGAEAKKAVIYLKALGYSDRKIGELQICDMPNGEIVAVPSRDTIEEWRDEEGSQYDLQFCRQYARACEDNLWDEFEKMRAINVKLENSEIEPAAARVICDNIKWDLARRLRHIFGDKSEVDLNAKLSGEVDVKFYIPANGR